MVNHHKLAGQGQNDASLSWFFSIACLLLAQYKKMILEPMKGI